jgi:hypothetical protein
LLSFGSVVIYFASICSRSMGATGAPQLRPWSMAMQYGFTTDAMKTKKELARSQENSLMPDAKDLEDVPFLTGMHSLLGAVS